MYLDVKYEGFYLIDMLSLVSVGKLNKDVIDPAKQPPNLYWLPPLCLFKP